jgi:methionine-rich copper-binding protein CopC
VAVVKPVVTTSTVHVSLTATVMTISGFGFDPVAAHNTVVLSNGAIGTVTAATAISLTVTFSTKPKTTGAMTAVVTTNSVSSGTAVQVATVA